MSKTCVQFFDQSFCMRTPTETEAGIILILSLCLIAAKAMRNQRL